MPKKPIRWVCNVFLAQGMQGWLSRLLLALVSVAVIALVVYGLGSGYQALAVKQSEAVARLNAQAKKAKKGKPRHSFAAGGAIFAGA